MYHGGQTALVLQFPYYLVQFSTEIQCIKSSDSGFHLRHGNVRFKALIRQPFLIKSWSISMEQLHLIILSLDPTLLSGSPTSFLILLLFINLPPPFLLRSHNTTAWRNPPLLSALPTSPMEPPLLLSPLLPSPDLTTHCSYPSWGCYLWSHLGVFPTISSLLHWVANSMFLDLWL